MIQMLNRLISSYCSTCVAIRPPSANAKVYAPVRYYCKTNQYLPTLLWGHVNKMYSTVELDFSDPIPSGYACLPFQPLQYLTQGQPGRDLTVADPAGLVRMESD